jgi:hypothetical protein
MIPISPGNHLFVAAGLLIGFCAGCNPFSSSSSEVRQSTDETVKSAPADFEAATPASNATTIVKTPGHQIVKTGKPNRLTTFPYFEEVASQLGVDFTYRNGAAGRRLMVESTGGGAGWLDFDGDGLLDLYLCQGGNPASTNRSAEPLDVLFRQVEPGRFSEVATQAAIVEQFYGQGVAVADFDDDGFDDIYLTNIGSNTLLKNQGDGTFTDVSRSAGVVNSLWSSSAAWGDLDGDGDLDLYVCNYVDYDPYHPIPCGTVDDPGTCHPEHMDPVPDECFFNQGDGTFRPEAKARGLFGPMNKALGVAIADLNNDGLVDVFVANDTCPNFLFLNQGNGQFLESASQFGCAVSRDGVPQANMGIGLGDFDRNGWLDLYVTHFTHESNTLYKNIGPLGFQDVTGLVGLHAPTMKYLAFGTIMTDFNQDGHEDIFVTNGHIDDWRAAGNLYEMEPQLFSFEGPRFVECGPMAGDFFSHRYIGRAVAQGDFDNDGDWDLAVVHQNSPTAILRNDSTRGNWLKLRFIASTNRRGWGTRVTLHQGETSLLQELAGGTSYAAAHEPALIFGLGENSSPVRLEIRWPDGTVESVDDISVNQQLVLRQPRADRASNHRPAR